MKPVRIYTTTYCGFCAKAKELLRSKGVAFEEVDVTGDDESRERLVELSGGRKTVPQIFVGAVHIGGYADLARLESDGKLDSLLT
jgi:glutaredoxin 3